MKVLQLIDSLEAGGAERMAVNCANELVAFTEASYLCVTRMEGLLRPAVGKDVHYKFLAKRSTLDLRSLFGFVKYLRRHKIDIIHAHTTSYFFATMARVLYPRIKIIWHEHHGKRVKQSENQNRMLIRCSRFFSAIVAVNRELAQWCEENLKTKKVAFIPNFVSKADSDRNGFDRSNSIVCLANLRNPKNHMNLLRAFKKVHEKNPDWELVLIGRKEDPEYISELERFISKNNLNTFVRIHGHSDTVHQELEKAKIGVLSSDMEGLPMALLEYGMAGLAVVATDVGECKKVVGVHGLIVPPGDHKALMDALNAFIKDERLREMAASGYSKQVFETYSWQSVGPMFLKIYKDILV